MPDTTPPSTCWSCPSTAPGQVTGTYGDGQEITTCPDCGEVREDV